MTKLILNCLLPDGRDPGDLAIRERIGKTCGAVGIGCNCLLFALKLLAGILTGRRASSLRPRPV